MWMRRALGSMCAVMRFGCGACICMTCILWKNSLANGICVGCRRQATQGPAVCSTNAVAAVVPSDSNRPGRVTFTLAAGLVIAMMVARSVLPPALRVLSRHASPELYQLTLIAFCLLCGWLSGFMVRDSAHLLHVCRSLCSRLRSSCTSSRSLRSAWYRLHVQSVGRPCVTRLRAQTPCLVVPSQLQNKPIPLCVPLPCVPRAGPVDGAGRVCGGRDAERDGPAGALPGAAGALEAVLPQPLRVQHRSGHLAHVPRAAPARARRRPRAHHRLQNHPGAPRCLCSSAYKV